MNTMQQSRLSTLRDYLALIVRRRWLIAITFVATLGLALVAAAIIPNIYVSESLILFQPGEVSTDFVKEITNGTSDERLTAIQENILSRSNLLKIIRQFEPQMKDIRGLSDDKKVDKIRKQLEIEFVSEKVRNVEMPITHVRIRYRDQNPQLAQQITARVASLFITKENETREGQVYGTTKFLTAELGKAMQRLAESGDKLKVVKERYKDQLPVQLESNIRSLDRLQQQKTANDEAIDRQSSLRYTLEQQISQTPPKLNAESAAATPVRRKNPLVDLYLATQAEYKDLLAKATDKHPDAVRLKAKLESLRQSIPPEDFDTVADADGQSKPKMVINPFYQNLTNQLAQVKTEIEIRRKDQRSIDAQIAEINRRLQNAPRADQEITAADRVYSDLAKQADDLRTKLDQARMAETLENKQQSAQFVMIDPANFPADPAAPNRMSLRLAGIGLSLGLALILGVGVDLSNRKVFTSNELERFLDKPVLVEIPKLAPARPVTERRRTIMKYAAVALLCAMAYGWGLYNLYSHKGFFLRVLDPIIQNAGQSNGQK